MSGDETVRDRIARTLYEHDRMGTARWPTWDGEFPAKVRDLWYAQADALLAAFPELGLFERLEAWLVEDHARSVELIGATRPDGFVVGVGPTFNEHVEPTVAAALSAALDQVETQERER